MFRSHREPPPAQPAQPDDADAGAPAPEGGPEQVPGFDERDADRGHRDNTNVEGGPRRPDTGPVDTEGS